MLDGIVYKVDLLVYSFGAIPEGAGPGIEGLACLLGPCLGAGGHRPVLRGALPLAGPGLAASASS